jgi:plastocyanin
LHFFLVQQHSNIYGLFCSHSILTRAYKVSTIMVALNFLFGAAALYAGAVSALPMPDSAIGNEVGVSTLDANPNFNAEELMQSSSTDTGYGWSQTSPSPSYQTTPPSYGGSKGDEGSNGYGGSGNDNSSSPSGKDKSWSSSTKQRKPDLTSSSWTGGSSPPSYTSYGSGRSNWGSNYDSCIQQCQAQFGGPSATKPPSSMNTGSYGGSGSGSGSYGGSSGGGATHTVIVAPSQGVLRYVPFAVNASVGDTVKFMWGANNHTVTKSSQLTPCNKTSDSPFTSGVQIMDFVFEQVVNDTNPLFFYCGVPTHCQKGMFGIINPPSVPVTTNTSAGNMIQSLVSKEMLSYAANATSGNAVASGWGQGIDMSALPDWSRQVVAENVLYTQTFLAANKDAISADGQVDVGLGGNPPVVPMDITMVAAANANSSTPVSSTPPAASSNAINPSNTAPAGQLSGATSVSRSGALVGFAALAAGFFLL